nr:VF530 family protein [uncultured Sphaerochaeta sp.]
MTNSTTQVNNPLHGITLENLLIRLVDYYGWNELYDMLQLQCFYNDPSIKSSLKFLRKNLWARTKLEDIYLDLEFYLNEDSRY